MAFLSIIRDFFESLFGGSLPEVKIKHGLRQIESALKNQQPLLYKNGMVQPNFAEALHVLYAATRSFKSVLAETLMSSDVRIRGRYTEQLFFTNLREEDKSLYNALSYENRRQEALDSGNASKTYDEQRRKMDKFLACFSSPEFAKIDIVIQHLEQFSDVCNFNYLSVLKRFDPQFDENVSEYKPVFQPVPIDTISTSPVSRSKQAAPMRSGARDTPVSTTERRPFRLSSFAHRRQSSSRSRVTPVPMSETPLPVKYFSVEMPSPPPPGSG